MLTVIDFCLTKHLVADSDTGFTSLRIAWASHTNCIQREGRVGRVQDGRVYRMVPKEFYMVSSTTQKLINNIEFTLIIKWPIVLTMPAVWNVKGMYAWDGTMSPRCCRTQVQEDVGRRLSIENAQFCIGPSRPVQLWKDHSQIEAGKVQLVPLLLLTDFLYLS